MSDSVQDWMTQKYSLNPNFLMREIGTESVIVPVGDVGIFSNSIISLNETSRFLWKLFEKPCSIEDVIKVAKEKYEADDMEIERDICGLVEKAVNMELLWEVKDE